MTRKVVQIAAIPAVFRTKNVSIATQSGNPGELYALCDDGTVWGMNMSQLKWVAVPAIPQDAPKE